MSVASELKYVYHPMRSRIMWAVIYVVIVVACVVAIFLLSAQIATHIVPVGKVTLTVPYSRYVVGDNITFELKNNYNSTIYVLNHCPSEPLAVYKQDSSGKWLRLHDQAVANGCTQETRQVAVKPGDSVNGSFQVWQNLFKEPGKYRVVATVEQYNALIYQDFEIIAQVAPYVPPAPSSNNTSNSNGSTNKTTAPSTTTPPATRTTPVYPIDD